jgi:hypothetical protein
LKSDIDIKMSMYPNGNKLMQIDMSGLKLFVHPYIYLRISHFFTESIPIYDMKSLDKPNLYDDDYEKIPEMHVIFKLGDSLICLANKDDVNNDSLL